MTTPEKRLQADVGRILTVTGWWWFHDHDSRRNREGLPDVLALRGRRFLVAELKREGVDVPPHQADVLARFAQAGAEVLIVRPADLESFARYVSAGYPNPPGPANGPPAKVFAPLMNWRGHLTT